MVTLKIRPPRANVPAREKKVAGVQMESAVLASEHSSSTGKQGSPSIPSFQDYLGSLSSSYLYFF